MDTLTSDLALIDAARAGDSSAFGLIVERYQRMVCAVTYAIVGDLAASEDAAQEAFLAAWRQLATLREPEKLRSWLACIARNIAHASRRRRRPEPIVGELPAADVTPDESAALREEEAILWRVLEEIPEQYREPLVLYYREHQSVAEVAETMNISIDAVKQRLSRGRQELKEHVAAFVETTLRKTGPKAAFTASVIAAINTTASPATAAAGVGGVGGVGAAAWGISAGAVGAIMGSVIGIAGGVFGTVASIQGAKSPAERALIIRFAWFTWIFVSVFVAGQLYVAFYQRWLFQSPWYHGIVWTAYSVILTLSIRYGNRRFTEVRGAGDAQE